MKCNWCRDKGFTGPETKGLRAGRTRMTGPGSVRTCRYCSWPISKIINIPMDAEMLKQETIAHELNLFPNEAAIEKFCDEFMEELNEQGNVRDNGMD